MNKINVAIADDNRKVVKLLEAIIGSDPELCIAGTAGNGEELMEVIREKKPDVVLLDIVMPKMDGLNVLEQVRGDDSITKKPAFIMITAVGQEKITEDAFELGADY